MAKNKVYYQGCISKDWAMCYYMECPEKSKCPQFQEYEKEQFKDGEKENEK